MPDDHPRLLGLAVRAHDRGRGLDDRGLFPGDLRDRVAQHRNVVARDGRDDRDLVGADHVGRVAPAAEAGLEHDDVAALLGKVQESQRGRKLKLADGFALGQRQAFARNRHALGEAGQVGVRDHRAVHPDALVKLHKVRRGIQPHPVARSLQYGRGHARGRALAVCAREVDKVQPVLRVAQRRAQCADAVQPGLAGKPAEGVDVVNRSLGDFGVHNKPFPQMVLPVL